MNEYMIFDFCFDSCMYFKLRFNDYQSSMFQIIIYSMIVSIHIILKRIQNIAIEKHYNFNNCLYFSFLNVNN